MAEVLTGLVFAAAGLLVAAGALQEKPIFFPKPAAGPVLITAFDSAVPLGATRYPFLPVRWLPGYRFEAAARASSIRAPALFVVAAAYRAAPPRHAKRLLDARGGACERVKLPGTDHNQTEAQPAYRTSIRGFLVRLRDPRGAA